MRTREHRNDRKSAGPGSAAIGGVGRESLSARIVRGLGGRILRGALKPGDRLPSEHELESAFGVSRAVVREAITSSR